MLVDYDTLPIRNLSDRLTCRKLKTCPELMDLRDRLYVFHWYLNVSSSEHFFFFFRDKINELSNMNQIYLYLDRLHRLLAIHGIHHLKNVNRGIET
jgi:hypothetical protein